MSNNRRSATSFFYKATHHDYIELEAKSRDERDFSEDEDEQNEIDCSQELNENYLKLENEGDGKCFEKQETRSSRRKPCFFICCALILISIVSITLLFAIINHNRANRKTLKSRHLVPPAQFETQLLWSSTYQEFMTEAAVRFVDVNGDGVEDVITGFGKLTNPLNVSNKPCLQELNAANPCRGGALAVDGKSGATLWSLYTKHEIFAVNCNGDLTKDGTADCLLGGREGVFVAVDSKNGSILWDFSGSAIQDENMNLYTAQFIHDVNNDGFIDVLQIHGGDVMAEPFSETRQAGKIFFVSGKTGEILSWMETPDKKESYFSPLVYTTANGTAIVIFGTGGETHGGCLYVIQLDHLYHGKAENAVCVYEDNFKGVMNPPVLTDVTGDGTMDLINAFYNSTYAAINGETLELTWRYDIPNSETYSMPAAGYYNEDETVDFMVRSNVGPGFPVFYHSLVTILDGRNGRPIVKPYKTSVAVHASPLTISFEEKGNDMFLFWAADCVNNEGKGGEYGVMSDMAQRLDTCKLRFDTKEQNTLYVTNRKIGVPGKAIHAFDGDVEVKGHRNRRHSTSSSEPSRKHLGPLLQRYIGTGGITKALYSSNDNRPDSIDVVFGTFWLPSTQVVGLTEEDISCIRKQRKEEGDLELRENKHFHGEFDPKEKAVKRCLKQHGESKGASVQTEKGKMIIYRLNIKPICGSRTENETCARLLPVENQGWGGYMGSLGNGYFHKKLL